jgi:hypothetical protein
MKACMSKRTAEMWPESPRTSTWWPPALTEIELFQGRACLETFAQSNHLLTIQTAAPCKEWTESQ